MSKNPKRCISTVIKKQKKSDDPKVTDTNFVTPSRVIPIFDIEKSIYIILDLETTGFVKEKNGITEIASLCLDNKGRKFLSKRWMGLISKL